MRIRLPTSALIVGIAALLATALVGVTYLPQQRERESLASQLSAARETLWEYSTAGSLDERLAAAEAELSAEQAYFPDKLSSAATLNSVLKLARESQVTIIDMNAQPARGEAIGNHTYSALSVHLQVAGSLPQVQEFVNRLQDGALKAVAIDEISITGMKESPTASLGFSVYARREKPSS